MSITFGKYKNTSISIVSIDDMSTFTQNTPVCFYFLIGKYNFVYKSTRVTHGIRPRHYRLDNRECRRIANVQVDSACRVRSAARPHSMRRYSRPLHPHNPVRRHRRDSTAPAFEDCADSLHTVVQPSFEAPLTQTNIFFVSNVVYLTYCQ